VDTGFHPYLLKAAFPHLTVMYLQDFEDYAGMKVPFVFERVVVADRAAAARALGEDEPRFVTAFEEREGARDRENRWWWEPIKKNMLEFLDLEVNEKEKVVTYLVRQDGDGRAGLRTEDHEKLVSALKKMERNIGCEVNVVYEDTRRTSWVERMEAIVRSTVSLYFCCRLRFTYRSWVCGVHRLFWVCMETTLWISHSCNARHTQHLLRCTRRENSLAIVRLLLIRWDNSILLGLARGKFFNILHCSRWSNPLV
jgi:hypothetical protein